jgi:hypothetical protein
MKPRLRQFLGFLLVAPALAVAQTPPPTPAASASSATVVELFTEQQLDDLLGPIALYPDALIGLILPASTSPTEIVLAARFLKMGNAPSRADSEPWDDSVRALARYPDTVRWMDENLAWTKQLGEAFLAQPDDVMNAIQRLRARALAAGNLFSTPQQQVVSEGGYIRILPAQPEVIFAPYYNPQLVYLARPSYPPWDAPLLAFGAGFSGGWWLAYNLDWPARRIVGDQPFGSRTLLARPPRLAPRRAAASRPPRPRGPAAVARVASVGRSSAASRATQRSPAPASARRATRALLRRPAFRPPRHSTRRRPTSDRWPAPRPSAARSAPSRHRRFAHPAHRPIAPPAPQRNGPATHRRPHARRHSRPQHRSGPHTHPRPSRLRLPRTPVASTNARAGPLRLPGPRAVSDTSCRDPIPDASPASPR